VAEGSLARLGERLRLPAPRDMDCSGQVADLGIGQARAPRRHGSAELRLELLNPVRGQACVQIPSARLLATAASVISPVHLKIDPLERKSYSCVACWGLIRAAARTRIRVDFVIP
jgi:hypothetical protein